MTHEELKTTMHSYRTGKISRLQMEMAIGLWQRKERFKQPDYKVVSYRGKLYRTMERMINGVITA